MGGIPANNIYTIIKQNYYIRAAVFLVYVPHDVMHNFFSIFRTLGNHYRGKLRQNAIDIIISCVPTIDVIKNTLNPATTFGSKHNQECDMF